MQGHYNYCFRLVFGTGGQALEDLVGTGVQLGHLREGERSQGLRLRLRGRLFRLGPQ